MEKLRTEEGEIIEGEAVKDYYLDWVEKREEAKIVEDKKNVR